MAKAKNDSAKSKAKGKAAPAEKKNAVIKMISTGDLKSLTTQVNSYSDKISTASGHMGDLIGDYAERKHLHKGAFGFYRRLALMGKKDSAKLWLFLAHFDHMREVGKLDALAKEQGQLIGAGVDGETENDETGAAENETDNVVTLTTPREVDETAGEKVH